jgi:cell division septation protein DedD
LPDTSGTIGSRQAADRRSHTRQSVLLSCLQTADDNGGIVLNVSERGMAMQVVRPLPAYRYTQVRFQLSLSNTWIETRGRIVWLNNAKNKAGLEFLEISDQGRSLLNQWIASASDTGENVEAPAETAFALEEQAAGGENSSELAIFEPDQAADREPIEIFSDFAVQTPGSAEAENASAASAPPAANTQKNELFASEDIEDTPRKRVGLTFYSPNAASRQGITADAVIAEKPKTRSRTGLFVGLAAMVLMVAFAAIFFARSSKVHVSGASAPHDAIPNDALANGVATADATGESFAIGSAAGQSGLSSKESNGVSAAAKLPRLSPNLPASSLGAPRSAAISSSALGFVLQVAAMKDEANALAFADALRLKNFPVFVIKPPGDPLFRVLVGPYSDAKSAANGEADLRKQGFQPIRKPNTPAQ